MFSYCRPNFAMKMHCLHRNFCVSPASCVIPLPPPSRREAHFWFITPDEIKSASLMDDYFEVLSPSEREIVFHMHDDDLRKRALLARTLVRTTIARYQVNSQITPRSLKFKKNLYGKPEVEWNHYDNLFPILLNFNISHTSSLIACGVSTDSQIGIDVEEKERNIKNNILAFARRYFSEHEVEFLAAISEPEVQRQEFLKLWTLKEAYVKALGRGFSASPFKTFTIRKSHNSEGPNVSGYPSYEASSKIAVDLMDYPKNLTSHWQFKLFELSSTHFAAVCLQSDSRNEAEEGVTPMKVRVWKTIPLVEDEFVSGTAAVVDIV